MRTLVVLSAMLAGALALGGAIVTADLDDPVPDQGKDMYILDDCDPTPEGGWGPGGCIRKRGHVSRAEFMAYLSSPYSLSVVGHPAWEFGPNYLKIRAHQTVRVQNVGGRGHTFTKVEQYGGGKIPVPALNQGLTMAPECATSTDLAPGGGQETVSGLAPGNYKFQCCIHPWMRAQVKVFP
jgi:plastocyanin